uniref:ATP synthase F0 subunit b n=1 Tax=Hydropuntia eucheumatoides TaxID=172970 RepID=UPI002E79AB3E|nr:ATP synthase F0 subunit b [Gracilaria eucheumatoides]WPS66065.1 ATP synthase F0 subunit b [Gracilaria eucheumatoides]
MLNISIVILLSLILISQNIILLNEETLILLCFITFCWICFNRLKNSISEDFENQKTNIKTEFLESFESLLNVSIKNLELQKIFPILITNFIKLEQHFQGLSLVITRQLPILYAREAQEIFLKKLSFTKRLEQQTSKLISLLLIKKIEKIALLKYFYITRVKISIFECGYKITLREYIGTI